jgi:alkanesulfonate monooxygenase SsuD/methylene tetrahydromethanopterin reductase-like flavin-dependent oxidoreductase (luciferase family)
MARTVDHLSNGRLEFGFEVGWHEAEHAMLGFELPPIPERVRWFEEACELIKRLWTEPEVTFTGTKYRVTRAVLEPKPLQKPYPHFVIGASGPKLTLRVTARHADEWNARIRDPETYRVQVDALERHLADVGRPSASIQRSVGFQLGGDDRPVSQRAASVHEYVRLGASHLIFQLSPPLQPAQVAWLWRELVPAIRDLAGR